MKNRQTVFIALSQNASLKKFCFKLKLADAKSTPSKSLDLHFSGLKYRPDREALKCSKICSKSSKISKKVDNANNPLVYVL